tara:strand:+ start:363 stop:599 length:237 start_codon:yes stop_codon:yes gene_type:complete
MKKLLLTFVLLISTSCLSVDERGRLEKVRIAVPALFQAELEYYKDKENKGKEGVSTNAVHSPYGTVNGYPKLMEMIKK